MDVPMPIRKALSMDGESKAVNYHLHGEYELNKTSWSKLQKKYNVSQNKIYAALTGKRRPRDSQYQQRRKDGYLWAISALATEKLQVRCVMETHVITIKPPLQTVDIGNKCEVSSASIYIPAKSELTATLQSVTRSQFFLEYNINYTNVSNFLIWYKLDFAQLTNKEIETLQVKY